MADDPAIEIRDLSYWYPGSATPALDGVDLEVGRGELVLLVGESGSGKSTLLRALNGLVPSYHGGRIRGLVRVDGVVVRGTPVGELARHVGLVFQDPERQLVMSRVDNEVAFGLENLAVPAGEIPGRVREALASTGLSGREGSSVLELSAGQQQRLALASVLATDPAVLALDEPTSQLDPEAAEDFLGRLDRERGRRRATVVLAEHRLDRWLPLADRVVVLKDGRVAYDGPPQGFADGRWEGATEAVLPVLAATFRCAGPAPLDPAAAHRMAAGLLALGRLRLEPRAAAKAGEALVRSVGVSYAYPDGAEVLRGVDLELRSGEVLALMGPNGAGKSTLARHLNGLLRPSAGRVEVLGLDAAGRPVAELTREVALLTQNPGDYLFERTVGDELRLTATFRGLPGGAAATEVARVAAELGLEGHLRAFSWDLSAGQRQRVALGALLVGAPRVLVLDEPTRGMDGGHRASLSALLRRNASSGKAVMVITHDVELAGLAADRWAVMEGGRVVCIGGPAEVFRAKPMYAPVLWQATEGLMTSAPRPALGPDEVAVLAAAAAGGGPR
jgi:energy-coupling factor transport system ATP-binding protein